MNGKVFELSSDEKTLLKKTDLTPLKDFLSATLEGKQYVLWKLYSFQHLPVELISGIYEEFLPKEVGTIYTPPFLAQFLVDQSMPMNEPKEKFKVFDPACGSGVFLVLAFKRLIEWWTLIKFQKTKTISYPDLKTLKNILKSSIYGVDRNLEAVKIAIFSLSIALCEYYEPAKYWTELKFDDLSEDNILNKNFFQYIEEYKKSDFDLVIGNPPFKNFDQKESRDDHAVQIYNQEKTNKEIPVPQEQIAFLFLKYSMKLLKPNGLLCMIMPAAPLLYNNTLEYRNKTIFEKYNVPQVLDFTFLADSLFQKKGTKAKKDKSKNKEEKNTSANVSVATIFVENKEPDDESILHVVVRNTVLSKSKQYFEIDSYDFHYVSKQDVLDKEWIWKANLMGGGRIVDLIARLKELPTLGKFIEDKVKNNGWLFSAGYQAISRTGEQKVLADYITGKKVILPEAIQKDGTINESMYFIEESGLFNRPKTKSLFEGPLLLIYKTISDSKLRIGITKNSILFKENIIGLKCEQHEFNLLYNAFYNLFTSSELHKFYLICTSGRVIITRETEYNTDNLKSLPFPENEKELKLSKLEEIIVDDVLNYYSKFGSHNQELDANVNDEQLLEYGDLLCKILNSVYEKNQNKFYQSQIIKTSSFIYNSFHYTNSPIARKDLIKVQDTLESSFEKLIKKKTQSTIINRIVLFYNDNSIYFIKPKNYRFWLKSIAIKDADEVLVDLIEAGY